MMFCDRMPVCLAVEKAAKGAAAGLCRSIPCQFVTAVGNALRGTQGELKTVTGNPVTITDGLTGSTVRSIAAEFSPVQDLHGYDNPWPAGGGKNKLQVTANTTTQDGVTFTVNTDGTVVANGTATQTVVIRVGTYIGEGVAVIASGCPSGGNRTDKYRIFYTYIGSDEGNGTSASTPEAGVSCNADIYIYAGYTATNLVFKPMIRLASVTDPTFAPYTNICPISAPESVTVTQTGGGQTVEVVASLASDPAVYIGTLNLKTGVVTTNAVMLTFDGSEDENWGSSSTARQIDIPAGVTLLTTNTSNWNASTHPLCVCSHFKPTNSLTIASADNYTVWWSTSSGKIRVKPNMTLSEFVTWLQQQAANGTPLQLIAELAEPVTYQLTPQQMPVLAEGTNVLSSDSGDLTVKYYATPGNGG